jgi:hypothetical protein
MLAGGVSVARRRTRLYLGGRSKNKISLDFKEKEEGRLELLKDVRFEGCLWT